MKNKKGFTLVELLAVIVILAVIAIIAIPIITNVIDKAKQGALKDSAYGILDSAEMYLAKNMNKGIDDTMEFTCNNGKCLSGTEEINYKGKIESGKVRIYADSKIELCVTDNKSSALKTIANKKVEVTAGTCDYGELNYAVTALVSKEALDEMTEKYNNLKALADQTDITAEDIKEGKKALVNGEVITGINKGTSVKLIGSYSGNQTIDVTSILENWEDLTKDNFIIAGTGVASTGYGTYFSEAGGNLIIYGSSLGVTYSTGKLNVTGASITAYYYYRSGAYLYPLTTNISYNIYYVSGTIEK